MTLLQKLRLTPDRVRMLALTYQLRREPLPVKNTAEKLPSTSSELVAFARARSLFKGEGTARTWEKTELAKAVYRKFRIASRVERNRKSRAEKRAMKLTA